MSVDVLLLTALPEEYDALIAAAERKAPDFPGVAEWRQVAGNMPYAVGDFHTGGGDVISMAVAKPTRMGGAAMGRLAAYLTNELRPGCLAMSGVCAGNPDRVALGDVVVAEVAYTYDEGKRTDTGFEGDHRQDRLADSWLRAAQAASPVGLPSYGDPERADSEFWLLERLAAGEMPDRTAARRYFPTNTEWQEWRASLRDRGLLTSGPDGDRITATGRDFVDVTMNEDIEGPKRLPFRIHVGPMASGSAVVKDGVTWQMLAQQGVRSVAGLEMEAATISGTAHDLEVPAWVVVKGVMDYADPRKDDRFKPFAARASAEVLLSLLVDRLGGATAAGTTDAVSRRTIQPVTSKPSQQSSDANVIEESLSTLERAESVAEVVRCLGSVVTEVQNDADARMVARRLAAWGTTPGPFFAGAPEGLLAALHDARNVARAIDAVMPERLTATYSPENGYRNALSFVATPALRHFVEDSAGFDAYRDELIEALPRVVRDRTVALMLLSHARGAAAMVARLLPESITSRTRWVPAQLGLHWVTTEADELTTTFEIFTDGFSFRTDMPDRVIGLIDYMRGRGGAAPIGVGTSPLSHELIDPPAWDLVLLPQAIAEFARDAEGRLEPAQAESFLRSAMDHKAFRVGMP